MFTLVSGGASPRPGVPMAFLSLGGLPGALTRSLDVHAPLPAEALCEGRLYRVTEGCLALYQRLDCAGRQILDLLGPGRILERGILERLRCEAMALAPTCLEPIEGPAPMLKRLAAENQELMLSRAFGHLMRIGKQGASERVAAALLDLSLPYAPTAAGEGGICFPCHPSRGDLADWLGLTLETVSRCLSRFKREGLITFGKGAAMTLTDARALREIARGERMVESIYKPVGEGAPKLAAAMPGA